MWFYRCVRKIIILLPLLLSLGFYLFYVRGFGVSVKIPPVASIRVGKKTYSAHWEIKKPMPTARTEVAAVTLNGKIIVVGGLDGFGRTLATVEAYDVLGDKWTRLPDLPQPRHHAAAVSYGGILFVFGGMTGLSFTPHADVFAYTDGATSWEVKAPLPAPRGAMAAAPGERNIYVIGGVGPHGVTDEFAAYYPADDRWETKTPALTKREHLAAATIDGKLFVAGGRAGTRTSNLALLEVYDPVKDTWSGATPMPTSRGGLAGATLENLFLVAGGEQPFGTFADVDAYDPKGKRWVSLPGLPTPRHGLGVATFGSVVFAVGGGTHPGLSVTGANEALYLTGQ